MSISSPFFPSWSFGAQPMHLCHAHLGLVSCTYYSPTICSRPIPPRVNGMNQIMHNLTEIWGRHTHVSEVLVCNQCCRIEVTLSKTCWLTLLLGCGLVVAAFVGHKPCGCVCLKHSAVHLRWGQCHCDGCGQTARMLRWFQWQQWGVPWANHPQIYVVPLAIIWTGALAIRQTRTRVFVSSRWDWNDSSPVVEYCKKLKSQS